MQTHQLRLRKGHCMWQAVDEVRPKRARRAKTAQVESPAEVDGGQDEDVAEVMEKPKKRRSKQVDPNAPPPFGELSSLPCVRSPTSLSKCLQAKDKEGQRKSEQRVYRCHVRPAC